MNHLAIYDVATGLVVGTTSAEIVGDPADGYAYIEYDPATDPRGWRVEDGRLIEQAMLALSLVRFTFNQWVDLFDLDEQVAIVTATMTDPMAKLIYDRAQSASGDIDPTDERTRQGLAYFVAKGWVSQATLDRIPQHI
jgi:hypothetical protein